MLGDTCYKKCGLLSPGYPFRVRKLKGTWSWICTEEPMSMWIDVSTSSKCLASLFGEFLLSGELGTLNLQCPLVTLVQAGSDQNRTDNR